MVQFGNPAAAAGPLRLDDPWPRSAWLSLLHRSRDETVVYPFSRCWDGERPRYFAADCTRESASPIAASLVRDGDKPSTWIRKRLAARISAIAPMQGAAM